MTSSRFLQTAMAEVAHMPWILGCKWTAPDGNGEFGKETRHASQFRYHELDVTFFTESELSPALFLHLRLLAQVVGEFYEGKRREQMIKQNAYMQAVHETGAKLTHDIKNLLQSLYALTSKSISRQSSASQEDDRRIATPYEAMLDRQLPQLTKRLQTTLDKLQNPALGGTGIMLAAADWWKDVLARHGSEGASFAASGDLAVQIPVNLFDTVLENCLENSRKKQQREPGIHVAIELKIVATATLTVTDTGSAIPSAAVDGLFHAPMSNSRGGGLGIGLYQAFKQAEQAGYALALATNVAGDVRFELRKSPLA
jgi:signal transduction histidine kinase